MRGGNREMYRQRRREKNNKSGVDSDGKKEKRVKERDGERKKKEKSGQSR